MVDDLPVPGDPATGSRRTSGVFRRWCAGKGRVALSFSVFEELYGPSRHEARIEMEEQKRVERPSPSPTDPPELPAPGSAVVSRPRGRFQGIVVLRRR